VGGLEVGGLEVGGLEVGGLEVAEGVKPTKGAKTTGALRRTCLDCSRIQNISRTVPDNRQEKETECRRHKRRPTHTQKGG
jgi:hypothetical protein